MPSMGPNALPGNQNQPTSALFVLIGRHLGHSEGVGSAAPCTLTSSPQHLRGRGAGVDVG